MNYKSYRACLIGITLAVTACDSGQNTGEELEIGAATSGDYVAIRVEAENFSEKDDRWVLTNDDLVPVITPDPDPPHHATASGRTSLEILPDGRVTHADPLITGTTNWGFPGFGPYLDYKIYFAEAGRYQVWTKAYSSGTEDNGIHVDINRGRVESGQRVQFCGGKNKWTWSSAQRTNEVHCGVPQTIYLDIDEPGIHTVTYFAREDGFEIDQFMMIKDNSNGTVNCVPLNNDNVQCKDLTNGKTIGQYPVPFTETVDGNFVAPPPAPVVVAEVDLDVDIKGSKSNLRVGDPITYTIDVENKHNSDTATDVKTTVDLPAGLSFDQSVDCTAANRTVTCQTSQIGPQNSYISSFSAIVQATGTLRVDAKTSASEQDTTQANNTDSFTIRALEAIPQYEAELAIQPGPNAIGVNDTASHKLTITNNGLADINDAVVSGISMPGSDIVIQGDACFNGGTPSCDLTTIPSGESISVQLSLTPDTAGLTELQVTLAVSGDENNDNNSVTSSLLVSAPTTKTDSDGVLVLEAESFISQNVQSAGADGNHPAWFINSNDLTISVDPDEDQATPENTSGAAYVEYLPDARISSQDAEIIAVSNPIDGTESSWLVYNVFFNQAGSYFPNALIRATNDQDASIHIGLNGQWPETASDITVCNPDGTWQWTNNQALDNGCNTQATASIEVAQAGPYQIFLAAAADGVEVDKLIFTRSESVVEGGLALQPIAYTNPQVDLAVSADLQNRINSSTAYRVTVSNLDSSAAALNVEVSIEGLDSSLSDSITGFDSCQTSANGTVCNILALEPQSSVQGSVLLGQTDVVVQATVSDANDDNPENNFSEVQFSYVSSDESPPTAPSGASPNAVSGSSSGGGGAFGSWLILLLSLGYLTVARTRRQYKRLAS